MLRITTEPSSKVHGSVPVMRAPFRQHEGRDWMRFAVRRPHARVALYMMGLLMRRTPDAGRAGGEP